MEETERKRFNKNVPYTIFHLPRRFLWQVHRCVTDHSSNFDSKGLRGLNWNSLNARSVFSAANDNHHSGKKTCFFSGANYHSAGRPVISYAQYYYKARRQISRGSFVRLRILAISHCDIAVSHLISSSLLPLISRLISFELNDFVVPNSRVPSCLISSSRHFPEPEAPGCSFLSGSEDERTPASPNQSRANLPPSSKSNSATNYRRDSPPATSIARITAPVVTSALVRFVDTLEEGSSRYSRRKIRGYRISDTSGFLVSCRFPVPFRGSLIEFGLRTSHCFNHRHRRIEHRARRLTIECRSIGQLSPTFGASRECRSCVPNGKSIGRTKKGP